MKQGFRILERNYLKPWGEIDIIAKRHNISPQGTGETEDALHFIEVKSISQETVDGFSRETVTQETVLPEENLTPQKRNRLHRAIKTYLIDRKISRETPCQLDLVTVRINKTSKIAIVEKFDKVC